MHSRKTTCEMEMSDEKRCGRLDENRHVRRRTRTWNSHRSHSGDNIFTSTGHIIGPTGFGFGRGGPGKARSLLI